MQQTVRIFISSPSDVSTERDKAEQVIQSLQETYYEDFNLETVRWEDRSKPANESYQEGIAKFVSGERPVHIAVFILWSVFGSPLTDRIKKPDGTLYQSGTEQEFDLMVKEYEKNRHTPVIFAYFRDDEPAFLRKLGGSGGNRKRRDELMSQKRLVERFVEERFQDKEGRNIRAYEAYTQPVGFAEILERDLRTAIDQLLGLNVKDRVWNEAPYRGLESFDVRHSRIFCGRQQEIRELRSKLDLQREEETRTEFVCIFGASGSGKSSLAKAGLGGELILRDFRNSARDCRVVSFVPTARSGSLSEGFVEALRKEVPSLERGTEGLSHFAKRVEESAPACADLLATALAAESSEEEETVRLLIIVDQLEELWTDRKLSEEQIEQFLKVLQACAKSRQIAVVATLRSDFYRQAHDSPTFREMKGSHGHFDLAPPSSAEMRKIILYPALRAGLKFEIDEASGQHLDHLIFKEIEEDNTPLPLLQFALDGLYQFRDKTNNCLTFEAYERLGGVNGALQKRLEEFYEDLPDDAEEEVTQLFRYLVTVSPNGKQNTTRRRIPLHVLKGRESGEVQVPSDNGAGATETLRERIVNALIEARFLVADWEGGQATVSIAHESLLTRWPQLKKWVDAKQDLLHLRAQIEQSEERWRAGECDPSLLLTPGVPLDEGKRLFSDGFDLIDDSTSEFLVLSIKQALCDDIAEGRDMKVHSREVRKEYPGIWKNALKESLESADAKTRIHATVVLLEQTDGVFEAELLHLLRKDDEDAVRKAAAYTLIKRGRTDAYDTLIEEKNGLFGPRNREAKIALARLLAVSDMQSEKPAFTDWYSKLSRGSRLPCRWISYGFRARSFLPVYVILLFPGVMFASLAASSVKWIPSMFNYSGVQATAEAVMGIFHSFAASFIVGSACVTGASIYRLVVGREFDRVTAWKPVPALIYSALFGFFGSFVAVMMIAYVYNPMSLYEMGWIDNSLRPSLGGLVSQIFFENRLANGPLWQFTGMGLAFGFATNHLRGGQKWPAFVEEQSTISTVRQFGKIILGTLRICLPVFWIFPVVVTIFSGLSLSIMVSGQDEPRWAPAGVQNTWLGGRDNPVPEELKLDKDASEAQKDLVRKRKDEFFTSEQNRRRVWKQTVSGMVLGLFGEFVAMTVGGFFVLVGMGVGIVIVRHGLVIAPQKVSGQSRIDESSAGSTTARTEKETIETALS